MTTRNSLERLGFLDALFGLVTQPGETTEALFETDRPKHIIPFLLLFTFVLLGPMAYLSYRFDLAAYSPSHIYGFLIVGSLTLLGFVFLEGVMLFLCGVRAGIRDLFACAAYSLAPLSAALVLLYLFNYFTTGDFQLVRALFGMQMPDGFFARFLPWAVFIIGLDMLLVLVFSLRALGDMHVLSAMCVAALSVIPLYGALLGAVIVAELALPGTRGRVILLLSSYT